MRKINLFSMAILVSSLFVFSSVARADETTRRIKFDGKHSVTVFKTIFCANEDKYFICAEDARKMHASAQTDSTPKKRIKSPATVKGLVGGESHDSYVVRARKNQRLNVQISWKERGDFSAAFVVSKSADFFAGDVLQGGTETYSGKSRKVKIRATGDYYIYVTGHPTANYTLKVSLK